MSVEKTLFSILHQELSDSEDNGCALKSIDNETYLAVLNLAEKHDIAHIVASAYSKAGLLGKDDFSEKYRKKVMMAFYRSEQKKYVLSEVSRAFNDIGIVYVPLKGSVICHYYPEAWMRSSCDIDILIKDNDAEKAIKCLCDLGYRLQKSTSIHDYSLFSPLGVHLELHFSLIQEDCLEKANSILENAWDYTINDSEHSFRKELTNEMLVFYHVAHMAKHFIKGGCGIRPFIDLWIMKRKIGFDSTILENLLSEAQLLEFYYSIWEVVNVWFENNSHSNVTLGIEEYIIKGGVYGTINNAAVISAATGESKAESFSKLMFMSRESLAILYPKLERYPMLYPFYQVKRWFRIFNKSKRNKIKHLTGIRNSVTKEEISSTAELLTLLGLNENAK
jgi:hypothetical protein